MMDEHQDDREFFQKAILQSYPEVRLNFAEDGEDAFRILASNEAIADLIFLDYNMPRVNGIEY